MFSTSTIGIIMRKAQRTAGWFLVLACLVILTCMAQRAAGLGLLQMQAVTAQSPSHSHDSADIGAPVKPCELSAKSLLSAPPVIAEALLLGFSILLTFQVMVSR